MKNTITTYEVWYKKEQYGVNRLWGTFTDEDSAKWAMTNAKIKGYIPTMFTFEK